MIIERGGCSGIIGRVLGRFFTENPSKTSPNIVMGMTAEEIEAYAKARLPVKGKTSIIPGSNRSDIPPAGRRMEGGTPVDRE